MHRNEWGMSPKIKFSQTEKLKRTLQSQSLYVFCGGGLNLTSHSKMSFNIPQPPSLHIFFFPHLFLCLILSSLLLPQRPPALFWEEKKKRMDRLTLSGRQEKKNSEPKTLEKHRGEKGEVIWAGRRGVDGALRGLSSFDKRKRTV